MAESEGLSKKKRAVSECVQEFELEPNPAITEDVIAYEGFPESSSKTLACLIMCYECEATTAQLKRISDQPAGIVRNLRQHGFVFQGEGENRFYYRNEAGQTCRKIVGFDAPSVVVRGRTKSVIEKSIAACLSAIEVYNKPDFKYREETFSILMVNAWELLLKARILFDNNNDISSIQVTNSDGTVRRNRSGNPFTTDIKGAMNKLAASGELDPRCQENINLLIEIRDNAVHYINKELEFSKKVQEIGTASLRNYLTAAAEWFEMDLSQYNFYLMPMSFLYPTDTTGLSLDSSEEEMQNMLAHFHEVEQRYATDEIFPYSISLRIEMRFVKVTTDEPAIRVKYSDDPDAPEVRVTEESVIERKYPLTYHEMVDILDARYSDFKQNQRFYAIKRDLEDPDEHRERYCRARYLNVKRKTGTKKKYYSTEIIKEFDKHYTKKT